MRYLRHGLALVGARAAAACVLVLLAAGLQAGAAFASPVLLDAPAYGVAGFGGWTAWSRLDEATKEYALVARSPAGVVTVEPVTGQTIPFDVELGPHAKGVVAVYSRCSNPEVLLGCRIFELPLGVAGAVEQEVVGPSGSAHEPAIWNEELVYLRRTPLWEEDGLYRLRLDRRVTHAVPLPVTQGLMPSARWRGLLQVRVQKGIKGSISGLAFNGRQIAYVTNWSDKSGLVHSSALWREGTTGGPKLVDINMNATPSAVCENRFVAPQLVGMELYAYLVECEYRTSGEPAGAWARYSPGDASVQLASFPGPVIGTDENVDGVIPYDGGVIWSDGQGAVQRFAKVSWHARRRTQPDSPCAPPHPIC